MDDIGVQMPLLNGPRYHVVVRENWHCRVDAGRVHAHHPAMGCGRKDPMHQDPGRASADIIGIGNHRRMVF